MGSLTLLLRRGILSLFVAEEGAADVIALGSTYLGCMAVFYALPALTNGFQGFYRGMGKMTTTLIAPAYRRGCALPLLRCWPRGWACPASPLPVPSAGASCWRLRCRIIFGRAGSGNCIRAIPHNSKCRYGERGTAKNGGQGAGRRFLFCKNFPNIPRF